MYMRMTNKIIRIRMMTNNSNLNNIFEQQLPPLLRSMNIAHDMFNKNALKQTDLYKQTHYKTNKEHLLHLGQFVYLNQRMFLDKNEKLADKKDHIWLPRSFLYGSVDIFCNRRTVLINLWCRMISLQGSPQRK